MCKYKSIAILDLPWLSQTGLKRVDIRGIGNISQMGKKREGLA